MNKDSIEVLISAMNQKDYSIVDKMNITGDCVLINQFDFENEILIEEEKRRILFSTTNEIGLSKSRNCAIDKSTRDICVIADDDLKYCENYEDDIRRAYEQIKDADIIIFNVESTNSDRSSHLHTEIQKLGFLDCMKVYSYQISFKRNSILDKNIKFDEHFGAGSTFNSGEENIFLSKCLSSGLKIYTYPVKIATVFQEDSTWFSGYNESYFKTKGAVFFNLSPNFSTFFILMFAIKKINLYKKDLNILSAIKFMRIGKKQYINKMRTPNEG